MRKHELPAALPPPPRPLSAKEGDLMAFRSCSCSSATHELEGASEERHVAMAEGAEDGLAGLQLQMRPLQLVEGHPGREMVHRVPAVPAGVEDPAVHPTCVCAAHRPLQLRQQLVHKAPLPLRLGRQGEPLGAVLRVLLEPGHEGLPLRDHHRMLLLLGDHAQGRQHHEVRHEPHGCERRQQHWVQQRGAHRDEDGQRQALLHAPGELRNELQGALEVVPVPLQGHTDHCSSVCNPGALVNDGVRVAGRVAEEAVMHTVAAVVSLDVLEDQGREESGGKTLHPLTEAIRRGYLAHAGRRRATVEVRPAVESVMRGLVHEVL
eukprot:CAMPEP_0175692846 /NCGR_PEP_ID=MMETSP0097-20121207/31123_1 /TAXON_ID=311494 /ORGANISM="Alexandrium monilatum, Strain CCMP3105" /LENGTH=320 /DNA_ID=CAMNT_0016999939 /DNA_START=154 /DNA_END=1113 /DNA_ORIENTATION=+